MVAPKGVGAGLGLALAWMIWAPAPAEAVCNVAGDLLCDTTVAGDTGPTTSGLDLNTCQMLYFGAHDQGWSFTAPFLGVYTFRMTPGAAPPMAPQLLAVLADCTTGAACRGSSMSSPAEVSLLLNAGETVWLLIDGTGDVVFGYQGPYSLFVDCPDYPETDCTDGVDNEGDGMADCADPDCEGLGCDDGDECTTGDYCFGGSCDAMTVGDGTPCETGDLCTEEQCWGGACVPWTVTYCEDMNDCTDDTCDSATGLCDYAPLWGTPCTDGDACTLGDLCMAGACTPEATITCPGTTTACHEEVCNPATGMCDEQAQANGTPCGPIGDPCLEDVCQGGGCVETMDPVICAPDGNECTVDTCIAGFGCPVPGAYPHVADGTSCTFPANPMCEADCRSGVCTPYCPCTAPPPPAPPPLGFDLSLPYEVPCPVFGGDVGAELEVSAMLSATPPACPACVGTEQVGVDAKLTIGLCKGFLDEYSIDVGLSVDKEREHCRTCDYDNSCEGACDEERYCQTRTTNLHAGMSISKFWGWSFEMGDGDDFELSAKCGATVSAGLAVDGMHEVTDDLTADGTSCPDCTACDQVSATASLPITAEAGCGVEVSVLGESLSVGCETCAGLGLTFDGTVSRDCTGQTCFAASARAGFQYQTPSIGIDLWLGGFELGCSGEQWIRCAADSCGSDGCDAPEGELFSCTAQATGLLGAALEELGIQ